MARQQAKPVSETEISILDLLDDLNKQYTEILDHFLFPVFRMKSNIKQVTKIDRDLRKLFEQKAKRIWEEKDNSVTNTFAPLLAEYSSLFKKSRSWIEKSGGDYTKATEMFMETPEYVDGSVSLIPPLNQSPGWI